MTYQQVSCPFCGQALIDDGSVTGQVVFCPACQNRVQMPGPAAPPPPPPLVMTAAYPITTLRRLSRPRPTTSSVAAIIWSIAGMAIVLVVGFIAFNGQHRLFLPEEAKVATCSKAAERKGNRPKPIAQAPMPSAAQERPLEPKAALPSSNEPPKSEEKPPLAETNKEAAQDQSAQDERFRNERKKLLDKLFDEQGERTRGLTRIRDARQATVASISDRIEKMQAKAGMHSEVVGGIRVTRLPKNPSNIEKLEKSLKPLEASLKDAKRELNDAEVELSALAMTYWLKEREILNDYRLSTEPKFQRYRGLLYTDAELAHVEAYLAAYATPVGAADHYAATLIDSGVIQAARRTDVFESAFGTGVRYSVQYVSKAGLVNVREGIVYVKQIQVKGAKVPDSDLFLPNGSYWQVTSDTKLAVMIGLP